MPRTLIFFTRTALLELLTALALGLLFEVDMVSNFFGYGPTLAVVQGQLLMGALIQLAMALGLWLLPLNQPITQRLQYKDGLAWTCYGLYNAGLLGHVLAAAKFYPTGNAQAGIAVIFTTAMQVAGVVIFVYSVWNLRLSKRAEINEAQ